MKLVKVLVLIAVVALAVPQLASAADTNNDIGVVVGYITPMSDSTIEGDKTEADSAMDYGIAYKHIFSNRLGVGANLLIAQHDVKVNGEKAGTIDNMPLLFDLNFHFLPKRNLYVGVTAGYSFWGDVKLDHPTVEGETSLQTKQNVVYGVNLGYDFHIGENWSILANVRYLGEKVEGDAADSEDVNVNPLVANLGLAYRF
jgi:outer membrane protein W